MDGKLFEKNHANFFVLFCFVLFCFALLCFPFWFGLVCSLCINFFDLLRFILIWCPM